MKSLSILGSTGSIGTQTLEIVKQHPKEFKIIGLTANSNIGLLERQIKEFRPLAAAVMDKEKADVLKDKTKIPVYSGIDGLIKIAKLNESDTVVNSLVGSIGIQPTYEAIKARKNIALANKETLVAAGEIIMNEVKKNNVSLMPIDSEHSAIFQCLNGEDINDVKKITITCSGGPFKNFTKEQLKNATKEDALKHPTWNMGAKITIDSATLMNKGFEVIEAHWLYGIGYDKIDVVIHPQSIIHSLVEFADNSVIAQLGMPDMKVPIQYALSYPKRFGNSSNPLDLARIKNLEFRSADTETFPCLKYAYEAGRAGGTMPAVMNAANEAAVVAFLEGKIEFLGIQGIIRNAMDGHKSIKNPSLKDILETDRNIKEAAKKASNPTNRRKMANN
ncbi:1-deoxy-D-xylulose-5-phosphate reductoisomerase [Candidatus Woesearchaeota archaeon]|nr:1-deoxy-D-xylulose-5-phosphate reductoisomerase [Candidatus Woesearchaeota archaeon]